LKLDDRDETTRLERNIRVVNVVAEVICSHLTGTLAAVAQIIWVYGSEMMSS